MRKEGAMSTDAWQCPACGYRLQYPVREDLDPVAWHEAGHTLMRWGSIRSF
jgi:hypothetical protein